MNPITAVSTESAIIASLSKECYKVIPEVIRGGDKPQPDRGNRSVLRPVEACPVVKPPIGLNLV